MCVNISDYSQIVQCSFTLFLNTVVCTPAVKSAEPFSLSKKKSPFPFEPQGVCLQTPPCLGIFLCIVFWELVKNYLEDFFR